MGVFNEFATAAFRYGHSQVGNTMLRLDDDWNILSNAGNLDLRDAYFNPGRVLSETGNLSVSHLQYPSMSKAKSCGTFYFI